jgi:osmotically-inducible protein OsmY
LSLHRKQRRIRALLTSNAVLRIAAAGEGRGTAGRFDDSAITFNVESALRNERSLTAPGLVVATEGRVVRLSGVVCSQAHMDRAALIARGIRGVLGVRNGLTLMPH